MYYLLIGVLLNRAPTSTLLHPPPPSSIHLHPAHFSLHPALWNTLNVIRTKISYLIGQFPHIQAEKFKVVHFDWKLAHKVYWRHWFWIQTSDPKIHFWANLDWKRQNCLFCLKLGTHGISRMLILIPALVFWISNQKSNFR